MDADRADPSAAALAALRACLADARRPRDDDDARRVADELAFDVDERCVDAAPVDWLAITYLALAIASVAIEQQRRAS